VLYLSETHTLISDAIERGDMSERGDTSELQNVDVEARIAGEFMRRLQDSDVDFRLTEIIEGQLSEDDFGGGGEIAELVEDEVLEYED